MRDEAPVVGRGLASGVVSRFLPLWCAIQNKSEQTLEPPAANVRGNRRDLVGYLPSGTQYKLYREAMRRTLARSAPRRASA